MVIEKRDMYGERWGEKPQRRLIIAVEAGIEGRYFASLIYAGEERIIHAGTYHAVGCRVTQSRAVV